VKIAQGDRWSAARLDKIIHDPFELPSSPPEHGNSPAASAGNLSCMSWNAALQRETGVRRSQDRSREDAAWCWPIARPGAACKTLLNNPMNCVAPGFLRSSRFVPKHMTRWRGIYVEEMGSALTTSALRVRRLGTDS